MVFKSTKQGATVVFRCENAWRKVWPTIVDTVNQQAWYGGCS